MKKSIRNDNLWLRHSKSPRFECSSCNDDLSHTISERALVEIIQNGLLKPSDFDRMNDLDFPEEKRVLLKMLLNN